jgi:hypothetical protein
MFQRRNKQQEVKKKNKTIIEKRNSKIQFQHCCKNVAKNINKHKNSVAKTEKSCLRRRCTIVAADRIGLGHVL